MEEGGEYREAGKKKCQFCWLTLVTHELTLQLNVYQAFWVSTRMWPHDCFRVSLMQKRNDKWRCRSHLSQPVPAMPYHFCFYYSGQQREDQLSHSVEFLLKAQQSKHWTEKQKSRVIWKGKKNSKHDCICIWWQFSSCLLDSSVI